MSRPSLFGPLVWWELVRLARRGQAARARVLLLFVLLLAVVGFALVWSYISHRDPFRLLRWTAEPLSRKELSQFGGMLAFVLLQAQLLFVAAITPAYAAAAVSEEKDRHTLSQLLATELTDREIVWGKAAARVLFVLAAVAAGIPVLALTLLLGGVDVGLLAAGYALTVGTVVLSACIGVSAACHAPDSRTALVRAYGQSALLVGCVLIPPFVLLSPFAMLAYYYLELDPGALRVMFGFGYPVGQVAIAWVLLVEAARGIRRAGPTDGPPKPTAYPEPPRGRPTPVVLAPLDADRAPLPPVDDADPVLWKERHAGRAPLIPVFDQPVRLLGALATLVTVALFATGAFLLVERTVRAMDPDEAERLLRLGPGPPDSAGRMLLAAGVFAGALYLLPLAAGVTGCVAGERFRGTLDPLMATPVGRRRVLRSKVRAHAERGLGFAGAAAAALGAGFGADGGTRLGLAAVAWFAAGVGLVIGLGAWLSVRCALPVRGFLFAVPAVVAVVVLPVFVWQFTDWEDAARSAELLAWGAAAFALAAVVLWWRAGAELERGG
jgi:ABC-type transport system involved in multi-copper enzyme maturation permease subunit